MLEHLEPTLERLALLVYPGLYAGDEPAARAGLAQAQAQCAAGMGAKADQEALGIYSRYLAFQVDEYFAGAGLGVDERKALRGQVLARALQDLQAPAQTEAGKVLRARV